VKVIMKAHAAFVSFAVSFALAGAHAAASTTASAPVRTSNAPQPATESSKATPASLSTASSPIARHLFPVKDEKGLLLTCVAPEMDTNSETDVFNNCTLAPGRTLDDVMHSFIRGIHEEQKQRMKEQAESHKDTEDKADAKSAQK
jgi:hypothetical protein